MPNGIPVATVALNASKNAGILAASILGAFDDSLSSKLQAYKKTMETEVNIKIARLKKDGWENNFD
jgi:5-(carboxyamino)imidazole ribonucleotide mutase